MQFQVTKVVHREGKSERNVPWAMDICTGILTKDDGTIELGEIILPKEHPKLEIKKTYNIVMGAVADKGRIVFQAQTFTAKG